MQVVCGVPAINISSDICPEFVIVVHSALGRPNKCSRKGWCELGGLTALAAFLCLLLLCQQPCCLYDEVLPINSMLRGPLTLVTQTLYSLQHLVCWWWVGGLAPSRLLCCLPVCNAPMLHHALMLGRCFPIRQVLQAGCKAEGL